MILLLIDLPKPLWTTLKVNSFLISVQRRRSSGSYSQHGDPKDCKRSTVSISISLKRFAAFVGSKSTMRNDSASPMNQNIRLHKDGAIHIRVNQD